MSSIVESINEAFRSQGLRKHDKPDPLDLPYRVSSTQYLVHHLKNALWADEVESRLPALEDSFQRPGAAIQTIENLLEQDWGRLERTMANPGNGRMLPSDRPRSGEFWESLR
ncbi:MAG: hypothetical protein OXF50_16905 [Caldilineaceae bacterium]|nr:hypothetical protein [Caldilineaceae bacterium]